MKRLILLTLAPILFLGHLDAQLLNQDAEGSSSIITKGGNIGLNTTKTTIGLDYVHHSRDKSKKLVIGCGISGTNSEGNLALFGDGILRPNLNGYGLIGLKFSHIKKSSKGNDQENTEESDINGAARGTESGSIRYIPYLRSEFGTENFTRDYGIDSTTFDGRFGDQNLNTYAVRLGVTIRRNGKLFIGASCGFANVGNLDGLTKTSYRFTQVDSTMTGGSLSKSKEFNAYSGTFSMYNRIELKADLMRIWDIDGSDGQYVGGAIYLRSNLNLAVGETIPKGKTRLGCSINFFNMGQGKFLGGLYFENNDLTNVSDNPLIKRFQAGITAKINFVNLD